LEAAIDSQGESFLEIGIGHDDVGRLAAELETDLLERLASPLHDVLASAGRPSERNLVDLLVLHQRFPSVITQAWQDIYHSFRKSALTQDLAQFES
jgi:hypothetical protein